MPATYWRGLIRQLIAMRALDVDTEGHGGLFLVQDEARPILRGEAQVMLRQDRPRPGGRNGRSAGVPSGRRLRAGGGAGRCIRCTRRCGCGGWPRRRASRSRPT